MLLQYIFIQKMKNTNNHLEHIMKNKEYFQSMACLYLTAVIWSKTHLFSIMTSIPFHKTYNAFHENAAIEIFLTLYFNYNIARA